MKWCLHIQDEHCPLHTTHRNYANDFANTHLPLLVTRNHSGNSNARTENHMFGVNDRRSGIQSRTWTAPRYCCWCVWMCADFLVLPSSYDSRTRSLHNLLSKLSRHSATFHIRSVPFRSGALCGTLAFHGTCAPPNDIFMRVPVWH